MKTLIINVSKCNGCYNCQISCKDEHVGNDWSPYAKPQPDTGQFWMKISETVRGTVPKVKVSYVPEICRHCDNAPCIQSCQEDAIYKRDDGIVIVDPEKCCGSRNCVDACPYGAIYFNWDLNIAQKCTMCAHLLDKGWKEPRCVELCPTGALTFGEEDDLRDLIDKAEQLNSDANTKPRVHYIDLPKRFVAGAVYDPEEDECVQGATIVLTDLKTSETFTAETDYFGDFWLRKLKVGKYSLSIKKEGYLPKEIETISTVKDVNAGDIELYPIPDV
ncbi:MAG: carboxypeptidase regulatory-like domain-containing protein [Deltaproteobacteria bacterium]|nr:carboxypeptidase regulatory-like domain-containing protein [Deltaproteobacteria bacterium]